MFTPLSFIAVAFGAACGAWLRWFLSVWFNTIALSLPLGTLLANLGGGYLIGLALGFLNAHPQLAPEWRLLIVTGFLGGLTTFSTFSAESFNLLQKGDFILAFGHSALHLLGSLFFCFAGWATWRACSSFLSS